MKTRTDFGPRLFLVLLSTYLLVPFAVTLIYSLFVEWTGLLPHGFTLRNYITLFTDGEFWSAMGLTLLLCTVSVLFTIFLLLLAMYAVTAVDRRLAGFMRIVCMLPYALQGVILSISILSLYSGTGTLLSNRLCMLLGAYTVLVLPYIYQGIRNSLNSLHTDMLLNAAEMLGCPRFRAYWQIVLPNAFSGILIAALLAQSIVFGDFVLANNIAGNTYQNIQVFLSRRMFKSSGLASAIVVVIFFTVLLITGAVLRLKRTESKEEA